MRKIFVAFLASAFITVGTVAGAAAFVPPNDPAGKFSCPGGDPVAGHPGHAGLEIVVPEKSLGAWNAVFAPHGTPIALCP
jgi:hypothetical protein